MAETIGKQQTDTTVKDHQVPPQPSLIYLEFVQIVALHAIVLLSSIYGFAKDNSGPLKPGVQTVEGTVKTVIGPVYDKFQDLPFRLLKFADRKVDGLVHKVDRHVPPVVKEAWSQFFSAAHKVPDLARSVSSEVQRVGVVETAAELAKAAYAKAQPAAKELVARYEPVAEKHAVSAWRKLNTLPVFPEVAHIVVPTAAYWSDKYNGCVLYIASKGYTVAAYMPLVPTSKIAKVFSEEEKEPKADDTRPAESDPAPQSPTSSSSSE